MATFAASAVICFLLVWSVPSSRCQPTTQTLMDNFLNSWGNGQGLPAPDLTPKEQLWFHTVGRQQLPPSSNSTTLRRKRRHTTVPLYVSYTLPERKEVRLMTTTEFNTFKTALDAMRTTIVDITTGKSEYDIMVEYHRASAAPAAHKGHAFLPWHREYLWRFERALQSHDVDAVLPYWDSTVDQRLPEPRDSILWSSHLLGNNQGDVITGLAAGWTVIPDCEPLSVSPPALYRSAQSGSTAKTLLFDDSEINTFMTYNVYYQTSCDHDCTFENDHGGAHLFVGGQMSNGECAPSDPTFWLHHAFIDCVWEDWRNSYQTSTSELDYSSDVSIVAGSEHLPDAVMEPFSPLYNIHGLSHHYTDYYYKCDSRPRLCQVDTDCGSSLYLWCYSGLCTSKIRAGGDCSGGLPDRACYSFLKCIGNVCDFPSPG